MSISGQNPLIGGIVPHNNNNNNLGSFSPQEWEFIQQIRRTGYDPNQIARQQSQMVNQSDPYSDFEIEFSKCSTTVQNRILNDAEFKQSMYECDRIMQATIEQIIRPQVIQTNEGRIAFERLLATFRNVKDKYSKEEADNMERLQRLMQDDVVKQRLAEIEKAKSDSTDVKEVSM